MELMVSDVALIEVPDPRRLSQDVSRSLKRNFDSMKKRRIGPLCEASLLECHSSDRARRIADGPLVLSDELRADDRRQLDDAVFELLGVNDAGERVQLVQRLHEATALHFRHIRVVEIEKQEQRSRTAGRRFTVAELAADTWDALELPDLTPLADWVGKQESCDSAVSIPEERPAELTPSPMFDPNTVYFGKSKRGGTYAARLDCTFYAVKRNCARALQT